MSEHPPTLGDKPVPALTQATVLKVLSELAEALDSDHCQGELCLFGASVMMLAFEARAAAKDVEAIFYPTQKIRELAGKIGELNRLPKGWLNEGVKGSLSTRHRVIEGNLPQFSNLRLMMPIPEYLLAMSCLAWRGESAAGDAGEAQDIVFLIRHLSLKSPTQVMEMVTAYYQPERVPALARHLVESLFTEGKI